ncbi:hypothetical protein [Chryseobacterium vrystaatense]|uniref:Lipoprotein n=1 Tax=Chryseobacterium vrystaatense TaxID=307480 RepID=A0ABR4URQ4_9FLAO|nr:hypothetical protein [Chryseobacterium vrystaatense]KFF27840.1 hypothetical protein IW16_01045 [Chryseobacterium vrystaatense]
MKLNKGLWFLLLIVINCNGQENNNYSSKNKEKTETLKKDSNNILSINFFDDKYKKGGYYIPDNLTGDIYPMYSYMDEKFGAFSVNYIGKTEEEQDFWNVYNQNGFFKNNKIEDVSSDVIEKSIKARVENYYIIVDYLDKKYIRNFDKQSGEFDISDEASESIYIYDNGKWLLLEEIKNIKKPNKTRDFFYDLALQHFSGTEKEYSITDSGIWGNTCNSNEKISFLPNLNSAQFTITNRFSMNAELKKTGVNKYEFYFTDFPPLIPLPDEMQNWSNLDNKKPVGSFEMINESKIELTWFGFYYKKTKKYIQTENPFNKNSSKAIIINCPE